MNQRTIRINARVPYARALCHDGNHLRRRCIVGRTAFGPGKFAFLHRFQDVRLQDVPHPELELPLRQCGLAFLQIMEDADQLLVSPILVNGPYPSYEDGATRFAGYPSSSWARLAPNVQQERIFALSGIDTDFVRYELAGIFLGPALPAELVGEDPCLVSGKQETSEASAAI